ncbi:hypothetical protein [Helicobacter equorum]|uniref:Uncharacterized protein n=1 Tax=Helicobacter equorum TaxID=361872 RepID=A0A3D8IQ75_9HELI|nr:hypothetical protein [Helicobacter equorum]RDU67419.1 hypothetical protein CQA54_05470 [Helicobacter equorum]
MENIKDSIENKNISESLEKIDKTKKNLGNKKITLTESSMQKIKLMIPAFLSENDIKDKGKDNISEIVNLAIDSLFKNEFKSFIDNLEE